jgi:hypothetical protein
LTAGYSYPGRPSLTQSSTEKVLAGEDDIAGKVVVVAAGEDIVAYVATLDTPCSSALRRW